jgi:hypothetical protein
MNVASEVLLNVQYMIYKYHPIAAITDADGVQKYSCTDRLGI